MNKIKIQRITLKRRRKKRMTVSLMIPTNPTVQDATNRSKSKSKRWT
jgi:hypothetical protein